LENPKGRDNSEDSRWGDNIRMDVSEKFWEGVDWMDVAQDRDKLRAFVNTVMNILVP
jgi:hypothetical protein